MATPASAKDWQIIIQEFEQRNSETAIQVAELQREGLFRLAEAIENLAERFVTEMEITRAER